MTYQVLARKWRPRGFDALLGQEHVVRALRHALDEGRLHHAYLFTGTRGVGKTTLARILAKCLNCETGVKSAPCGICAACTEIDGGRFPDYVEMDAASNRGVDEMTQLLERAVYAPTAGRFKVYMIDEVHQLSGHAFNAMLKTLEEPPAHLKFVLATTDPQKVPVTVLSRCLQFNLKQMPPALITGHLAAVLESEQVAYEAQALPHLARAAAGSMRDALSLLDQAIAHGAGRVGADDVRAMLGTIDQGYLFRLLEAVADDDAGAALALAGDMLARSLSFDTALQDLAGLLLRVAIAQAAPEAGGAGETDAERIGGLARRLDPETVQLYYQIAVQGREDLPLAPDEHAGFAMTLLRMLAFRPETKGLETSAPAMATPASAGLASPVAARAQKPAVASAETLRAFDGDWAALVVRLPATGVARELARHSILSAWNATGFELQVPKSMAHLAERSAVEKLRPVLESCFGQPLRLKVGVGEAAGESVAAREARSASEKRAQTARAVQGDPFVQELVTLFDGRVLESGDATRAKGV